MPQSRLNDHRVNQTRADAMAERDTAEAGKKRPMALPLDNSHHMQLSQDNRSRLVDADEDGARKG